MGLGREETTRDRGVKWLAVPACPHPVFKPRSVVTVNARRTHDILERRLQLKAPLAYAAGQYARLAFPGLPARDYSMAPSERDDELVFHIREVAGGRVSAYVAQVAQPGSPVQVEGPFGEAYRRERPEEHTSEYRSLMCTTSAVLGLKKNT